MNKDKAQKILDDAGMAGEVTDVIEDMNGDGRVIAVVRDVMDVAGPTGTSRVYIDVNEEKIVEGDTR